MEPEARDPTAAEYRALQTYRFFRDTPYNMLSYLGTPVLSLALMLENHLGERLRDLIRGRKFWFVAGALTTLVLEMLAFSMYRMFAG
jgi:hypothetical protein